MVDKVKKVFGKIHVLDIIFVVLLIVVVIVVGMKLSIPREETIVNSTDIGLGNKDKQVVNITMITEPYEITLLNEIDIAAKLVENKDYIDGEVLSVEIVDHVVTKVDNNGDKVTKAHPYLKKAIVVAKATVSYKEPIYKLGTLGITENKEYHLNTNKVKLTTIITEIARIED